MQLPPWAALLTVGLATVLFLKTILSHGSRTYNLPPGPKRVESLEYIRDEEVRVMLRELNGSSGRTVRLRDYLQTATHGVISRMVLGKKYVEEEVAGEGRSTSVITPAEFGAVVDEFFVLS